MYPIIVSNAQFSYVPGSFFSNDKTFLIPTSDIYLLGVLNSSPAWFFLTSICSPLQNNYLELRKIHVENIPIPSASGKDKKAIETLVQKCLDAQGQNCQGWEAEINAHVAGLYGLTDGENTIVETK